MAAGCRPVCSTILAAPCIAVSRVRTRELTEVKVLRLTLGSQLERFIPRQTHHDAAVRHSFQHEAGKGRSTTGEGGTRVEMLFFEEATPSNRAEQSDEDLAGQVGGRLGGCDSGQDDHAFAYLYDVTLQQVDARERALTHFAGRVRHGSNDPC